MFKRKIYSKLLSWKEESNGNTALLIEGARRIGKSTVVDSFAKNEYQSYIFIDFSTVSKSIKALFEDISDLDYLFLQLQLQYKVDLHERNSLIIFDEVQLCPLARQAIKSLVKDHRYDYIETGSLISIKKNIQNILIPSEERKLSMYPMDYEEFLWALGDHTTTALVRKLFDSRHPIGDKLHRKLMRDFRLYMLVGGMPQAVNAFVEGKTFAQIDFIKRNILSLYEEDLAKYDTENREKASVIFKTIPEQLENKNSHFRFSLIDKNARNNNGSVLRLSIRVSLITSKAIVIYEAAFPFSDSRRTLRIKPCANRQP